LDELVYFLSNNPALDPVRIKSWIWHPYLSKDFISTPETQGSAFLPAVGWPWDPILALESSSRNLKCIGFAWIAPPFNSPVWENKDEIHLDQLDSRSFDEYAEIITRSPHLEVFKVRGFMIDGPHINREPMYLNRLRILSLMDVPFSGLQYFFKTFSFPCLMELSIRPSLPGTPDETIYTLLTFSLSPLPLLDKIKSVNIQAYDFGTAGELLKGRSDDSMAKIFISLVYRGGFGHEIHRNMFDLFPNMAELVVNECTCIYGAGLFAGSPLLNFNKLTVLPNLWFLPIWRIFPINGNKICRLQD